VNPSLVMSSSRLRRKPFTPIRKGIIEHVLSGRLRGAGFAVYIWLHLQANHETGTVRTNATRLASELGFHPVTIRRELAALRRAGYVRYAGGGSSRQLYEISIEKYHDHFEDLDAALHGGLRGQLHGRVQERGASPRSVTENQPAKNRELKERKGSSDKSVGENVRVAPGLGA
jgi:hypothetical protein